LLITTLINLPDVRRKLISKPAMAILKANLPQISRTQPMREAIRVDDFTQEEFMRG